MSVYDRILITGGGGMLAKAFGRLLPGARIFGRSELDLTASDDRIFPLFTEIQPAVVINCAAYTKVDLAEQEEKRATDVNGAAVGRLVVACNSFGAKLV